MEYMTPRERMMTTLRNRQPDRIPVAPDISNMVPCRLTGKPFWDIYINNDPPLWRAYIGAVKYYGMDGWFTYGELKYKTNPAVGIDKKVLRKVDDRWEMQVTYNTPDGDLTELIASPRSNPPTHVEKVIKDFKEDFNKYKHFFPEITGYESELYLQQKRELGELGIMGNIIIPPGLHWYVDFFNGSLEAATYAYYDYPELFEELREVHERYSLRQLEMAIDAGMDSILTGGSGSITLQSPEIWRKLSLPTLIKITRMCREAGVISGIHSCGKELYLLECCVNEIDLDYANPLEVPAMGDCNLAECKKRFGHKLALMGNLHTTETMLNGSADDVKRESLKAILDAGTNGGFVLSTGDQCGRDTPDANIFAMVQAVNEFGHYPLDIERMENEIMRLA